MIREPEILRWIDEESREAQDRGEPRAASLQLLIVRLALSHKESLGDLTKSLEISINRFDRENLYRIIRELCRKGWVEFIHADGSPLPEEDARMLDRHVESERALGFIRPTPKGELELRRLQKVQSSLGFRE